MMRWVWSLATASLVMWGQDALAQNRAPTIIAPAALPSLVPPLALVTWPQTPPKPTQVPMPPPSAVNAIVIPKALPATVKSAATSVSPPKFVVSAPPPSPRPVIQPVVSLVRPDPTPLHLVKALAPPPPMQMANEIAPFARDLVEALRPSLRQRAATALAEGRYGWRPEVKALLVQAAKSDPAPAVRATCIRLLSDLGFHETRYLEFLYECLDSDAVEVRGIARLSLTKLSLTADAR